ncbi:NAD(P)/FAD-dependent oxidoreductase [Candidatus Binatia bacterium]|jgi:geranylgeranyl reductase family protein|nr:NAD(P)/FAD-dependent oxidoreductase [Candidatus Binatia bacterium]
MAETRDLVIVGGGPAGSATAIALARLDPGLAARTVLLDRAAFPRDKTCAGGLIPHTLSILRELGLELTVPAVQVDQARVDVAGERIDIDSPGCCWVIRRREFDAMLLDAARGHGVEVRESVRVVGARRDGDHVVLETEAGPIRSRAVVGADGSGSLVRRALVNDAEGWIARAVMCDVPIASNGAPARFEFDFRAVLDGLSGYAWSFPCLIEGRPHWNVGVYSLARRGEGERLARLLDARAQAPDAPRKAHPIRLYRGRERISAPGVLLVGDAAGVDPLLGEGISFALQFGQIAARVLADGFATGDLRFRGYDRLVRRSPMGRKLRRLGFAARMMYGPAGPLFFRVARLSRRAQITGMNWYNGVAH